MVLGARDRLPYGDAGDEGGVSLLVADIGGDRRDGDLEEVLLLDASNELLEFDPVGVLLGVVLPHVTVGLRDLDVLEQAVVLRGDLDLDSEILGDDGEQASESIDEHLIDLAELLDEVEITVSENGDVIHELGVVVGAVPETVYREILLLQNILVVVLDSHICSTVLPITEQEDTCDRVLVLSVPEHLDPHRNTGVDRGTTSSVDLVDDAQDLLLILGVYHREGQDSLGGGFKLDQAKSVVFAHESQHLLEGILEEFDFLALHGP